MGNESLYHEALSVLVGGVNSPIRALRPYPFFTTRASGAYLHDVEGNRYIDYCLGYGPLILGHANPCVVSAICEQAGAGTIYGTPSPLEISYAKVVLRHLPGMGMIRCVSSGSEATMAALRLARGVTGRDTILAFDGAYHGSHDGVLAKGSPSGTMPSSKGVTHHAVSAVRHARFNDIESVQEQLEDGTVAAAIIEPVMGNMGCIPPRDGFLRELRSICSETGTLLIFDEVITGFRLSMGGAQDYFCVQADIATYGKIAGGGLPIGVVASSREIMEQFSPVGGVYNAGTFNGNPLSMAAGLAALSTLGRGGTLGAIHRAGERLVSGLRDLVPDSAVVQSCPGMFQIYFGATEVLDSTQAKGADAAAFATFWRSMLDAGVFMPPSMFESNFVSSAHDDSIIHSTLDAAGSVLP